MDSRMSFGVDTAPCSNTHGRHVMGVLRLQKGVIYGPVRSRRLGKSLGINVLPSDKKVCTFDCCYCQYGRTRNPGDLPERLPAVERILEAVEAALKESRSLDAITFSGNGEPTMHPDFPAIVREVRHLRDRLAPGVPIALLSNSSLSMDERIRTAISGVELRIMKLDVGNQEMLEALNGPGQGIDLERIISGLAQIPDTIIQTLFVKGSVDNRSDAELRDWLSTLSRIRPMEIQIYSLDRPVPEKGLKAVDMKELESISELVKTELHLKARTYGR